jgi:hypothetical protein
MRSLEDNEEVKYLSDGHLYIDYITHAEIYEKGFCLENFYQSESGEFHLSAFVCTTEIPLLYLSPPKTSRQEVEKLCKFEQNFEILHRWLRFIYTICGFLSLLFLALSLFFYMTLPELRNFQGNIVCAYIMSMSLSMAFLITIYNIRSDLVFKALLF